MGFSLWNNHSGELRRETAEQKAERIITEELTRLGWTESDVSSRMKSDPGKPALAARLRKETTLPMKWVAARVQIGTSNGARSVLHRWRQAQGKTETVIKPCAQVEFQSQRS